jgi:hypothetical protein
MDEGKGRERGSREQRISIGGIMVAFPREIAMKNKAKGREGERRNSSLLLALVAALFVVLLLIRALVFVAGSGGQR